MLCLLATMYYIFYFALPQALFAPVWERWWGIETWTAIWASFFDLPLLDCTHLHMLAHACWSSVLSCLRRSVGASLVDEAQECWIKERSVCLQCSICEVSVCLCLFVWSIIIATISITVGCFVLIDDTSLTNVPSDLRPHLSECREVCLWACVSWIQK